MKKTKTLNDGVPNGELHSAQPLVKPGNLFPGCEARSIRSFLAIEIPEDIRQKIYEAFARLHRQTLGVKWIEAAHMHLTLKFLGDVEADLLNQEVLPRLDQISLNFKALSFALRGVGVFPTLQKPRIFWLGIEGDLSELKRLQMNIEKQLKDLPLHLEKNEFHPHITLGRIKEIGDRKIWQKALEEYEKIDFGNFQVSTLTLFKSELTKSGPVYSKLKEFVLSK